MCEMSNRSLMPQASRYMLAPYTENLGLLIYDNEKGNLERHPRV